MKDYSISEEFTLPSKGKIYGKEVNPVVKIRSMTTMDEMKRLSPSEDKYKQLCEVIDSCIVDDIGISSYDMCLSDYQYALQRMRVATYGAKYDVICKCPYCLGEHELSFNLDEIEVIEFDEMSSDFEESQMITLPKSGNKITLKFQTPRMMDNVNRRIKELKKKSKGKSQDKTLLFTILELIDTVDGEKMDPILKERFVENLPMMDTNYILRKAQKLVESFGVVTEKETTCPICGLDYTGNFRITSEFFGPRDDA